MSTYTHADNNATSFIATMLGGIMALFGGLTATEQMALIGTCVAVLGFAVNTWAVWRRDKREQRFIEWKMVHKNDKDETL